MRSRNVIMLSDLKYPIGPLNSYLFKTEIEAVTAFYHANGTFIWNDTEDVLDPSYEPPEPYYKQKTGRTSRPFIPLSEEEYYQKLNTAEWLTKHVNEVEIAALYHKIKEHLKSRNFNAAKRLLPALGKLNKQDYSIYLTEECPECILLRLFNINKHDRSFKITKSRRT